MSEKDSSKNTSANQEATSDKSNADANEEHKSGIRPGTVFFIMLIAAFWFNYEYDVWGFKKNFPFVKVEEANADMRQWQRKFMSLEYKVGVLENRLSEEQAKRKLAEAKQRQADDDLRDERRHRQAVEKERKRLQSALDVMKEPRNP